MYEGEWKGVHEAAAQATRGCATAMRRLRPSYIEAHFFHARIAIVKSGLDFSPTPSGIARPASFVLRRCPLCDSIDRRQVFERDAWHLCDCCPIEVRPATRVISTSGVEPASAWLL